MQPDSSCPFPSQLWLWGQNTEHNSLPCRYLAYYNICNVILFLYLMDENVCKRHTLECIISFPLYPYGKLVVSWPIGICFSQDPRSSHPVHFLWMFPWSLIPRFNPKVPTSVVSSKGWKGFPSMVSSLLHGAFISPVPTGHWTSIVSGGRPTPVLSLNQRMTIHISGPFALFLPLSFSTSSPWSRMSANKMMVEV